MVQFFLFNSMICASILLIKKNRFHLVQYALILLICGIISVTQLSTSFLFDTGAYHVVLSKWVAETGLTKGIANLDLTYGVFSPIFFLGGLSLNLYSNQGWQFINGAFFSVCITVFLLLIQKIDKQEKWIAIPTFALVFYFNRGYITSLSPDLWLNLYVPFFLFTLFKAERTRTWTTWVKTHSVIVLFMIWIKLSSLPLLFVGIFILLFKRKEIEWNLLFQDKRYIFILLSIPLAMVATNIYISGYPLYPVTLGGVGVPWKVPEARVERLVQHIYLWGITPNYSLEVDYSNYHWISDWIKRNSQSGFYQFELLLLVTLPLQLSFIWKIFKTYLFPKVLILLALSVLIVWFNGSPNMRFLSSWLYSFFGLFIGVMIYKMENSTFSRLSKYIHMFVYLLVGYFLVHSAIESGIRSKLLSGDWKAWIYLYDLPKVEYRQYELEDGNPVFVPTKSKQPWLIPLPGSRQFPVYAVGTVSDGFYPSAEAKSGIEYERP